MEVRLSDDDEKVSIVCHEYDLERDFYVLHLEKNLTSGHKGHVEMK